jgi:replicative DNA helicase
MQNLNVPPSVPEFEDALISTALVNHDDCLDIVDSLQAHHFYQTRHQKVFGIISEMVNKGIRPDLAAVFQVAQERDLIEQVGGALKISQLVDAPVPTDLDYYLSKVKEKYALRKSIEICNAITKRCFRDEGDAREVIDRFQQEIFELGYGMQAEQVSSMSDIVRSSFDHFEALFDRGRGITGIPSGFRDWDWLLSGFQKTEGQGNSLRRRSRYK